MLAATSETPSKMRDDLEEPSPSAGELHYASAMEYGFMLVESRNCFRLAMTAGRETLYYGVLRPACVGGQDRVVPRGGQGRYSAAVLVPTGPYACAGERDEHALLSWTGTMFEYMMPALWMRAIRIH